MTERTRIERVGGHLLVTAPDAVNLSTGERLTATAAYPIGSLVVETRAPFATVSAVGSTAFVNVSDWTAREILEVAYGGGEKPLVSEMYLGQIKAKDDEIAVLREALRRVFDLAARETQDRAGLETLWAVDFILTGEECVSDSAQEAAQRVVASIHEAAGVER